MKTKSRHRTSLVLVHRLLREAGKFNAAINAELLSRCGISLSEKELLVGLFLAGGQLRMSEVSSALQFTQGGATKLIGRLVNEGFVERQRSTEDRRVMLVNLTTSGDAKLKEALKVVEDVVIPAVEGALTAKEQSTVVALLEKLSENTSL